GTQVVPYGFDLAQPFSEGLAPVLIDSQWGYIDKEGSLKIGAEFKLAKPFSEGLAAVKVGEDWGFIDKEGKIRIEPKYASVRPFNQGLAIVYVRKGSEDFPESEKDNLKSVLADPNTPNLKKALLAIAGARKAGFIDREGKFVIAPDYLSAQEFNDGLALVRRDGKFVYIDKTGKPILTFDCSAANSFSQGLASVQIDKKWGFIDTTGKLVIKPRFEECDDFHSSLAAAREENKFGFIDKKGKWVIEPQFDTVWEGFLDGIAVAGKDMSPIENSFAEITKFGGGFIISRKKGKDESFDETTTALSPGYFAYPDLKFALIKKDGTALSKFEYEQIANLADGLRAAKIDGKFGYIDNAGNMVIKPQFKWANNFSENVALIREGKTKSKALERAETLLKHAVPSLINNPELIKKDIEVASSVIKLDPANTQALRDRGFFFCSLGEFEKSLADFSKVIEICPTSTEGYYWRGHAYLVLKGYEKALADFNSAAKIDNSDPQHYAAAAVALLKLGRLELALKNIERALRLDGNKHYRQIRGDICEKLDKPDQALKDHWAGRLASKTFPWPAGPQSLFDIEKELKQKEKLYQELKNNNSKCAEFAFATTDLADSVDALRRLKSREKRMLELEALYQRSLYLRKQAIEANPGKKSIDNILKADLANATAQLASFRTASGNLDEAEKLTRDALTLAKDIDHKVKEADYLNDLAKIQLARNEYQEAETNIKGSLELSKDAKNNLMKIVRGQSLSTYAVLLSKLSRHDEAQAQLEKARELLKFGTALTFLPSPPQANPDASADEMLNLARQCTGLFLLDDSRRFAQKSLELAKDEKTKEKIERFLRSALPKEPIDLPLTKQYLVAQTAELAGDLLTAESYYQKCSDQASTFEGPYIALARLNRLTGSLSKAEKMVKKAIAINPDSIQAWLELSRINQERGRTKQADQAIEEALIIDPDNQSARFQKSKLEKDRLKKDKAVKEKSI
ncbi:MAG: WG repeat-containing protein, partial [Candidatus Obscuribacterales bacterium]|nr:WG repeat-containing protein [Candidatus Obscuribacterales bacterium]